MEARDEAQHLPPLTVGERQVLARGQPLLHVARFGEDKNKLGVPLLCIDEPVFFRFFPLLVRKYIVKLAFFQPCPLYLTHPLPVSVPCTVIIRAAPGGDTPQRAGAGQTTASYPWLLGPISGLEAVGAKLVTDEPREQLVVRSKLREEPTQDPLPTTRYRS